MDLARRLEEARVTLRQLEDDAALHTALYDRAQILASTPAHPLRVQARGWLPVLQQGIHEWGEAIARVEREIAELEEQIGQTRQP